MTTVARMPNAFEQFEEQYPDARWLFTTRDKASGIIVSAYRIQGHMLLVAEQYSQGERADWWNVFVPSTKENNVLDTWAGVQRFLNNKE